MSITRTQIAKQLLANGGRIGLFKGAEADARAGRGDISPNTDRGGNVRGGGRDTKGSSAPTGSVGSGRVSLPGGKKISSGISTRKRSNIVAPGFRDPTVGLFSKQSRDTARALLDQRMGFGDRFIPDFFPITQGIGNIFQVKKPTFFDIQRKDFIRELGPKPFDAQGFGSGESGGPQDIPYWAKLGFNSEAEYLASLNKDKEQEPEYVNPLSKLSPRIAGSQFAADGGRIGAQEGGIMPRLNQLGSGVSSAEQMLQGINQRLESAESSLGSDGVRLPEMSANEIPFQFDNNRPGPIGIRPDFNAMVRPGGKPLQQPLGQPPAGDRDSFLPMRGGISEERMNALGRSAIGNGFYDFNRGLNNLQPLGNQGQGDPLFEPKMSGIPAAGYADGGRITSLEDMDREGFLLGGIAKGLKKAVRGIKKLAKSPIGKAALGFAALRYGGGFGKGLKSKLFGTPAAMAAGPFNYLQGAQKFTPGLLGKLGLTTGGGSMALTGKGVAAAIGLPSILAGLTTPKEDEDKFDLDSYYASGKLNPSLSTRMMGSDFDFYGGQRIASAEGGSTDKEPVAKKTMPLLDMDGKEMDLREEGGFVPIGRMEKADDVPARLSKNEFVFTADAVRNAGDGDVDKGAEVMYNMMKNLEAGGEVSEESQGLEGARKMFQTSQRLEEVL